MNWSCAQLNDPLMSNTEINIVHLTHQLGLTVVGKREGALEWLCHVDFSVEAIQLSSSPLSDSEIDKVAQLPGGRGEGLYKSCDVTTFCVN